MEDSDVDAGGPAGKRFNGATAVTPWKTLALRESRAELDELQWGHGGDAVEDADAGRASGRRGCFNGATAVTPWNDS